MMPQEPGTSTPSPGPRPPQSVHKSGRRRIWPWLLGIAAAVGLTGTVAVAVVVAILVVVGLAVLAVVVFAVFVLTLVATAPVSHGPAFVDALAADNDQAAYDLLCEQTMADLTFDEFQAGFAPVKLVASTTKETSGSGLFEPPDRVDATFYFEDGTSQTVTYTAEPGHDGNLFVCDPPPLQ